MKIFIWDYIDKLTNNYHSEGGLVVIAKTLERAKQLAEENGVVFDGEEAVQILDVIHAPEEKVYIFPDAGCC